MRFCLYRKRKGKVKKECDSSADSFFSFFITPPNHALHLFSSSAPSLFVYQTTPSVLYSFNIIFTAALIFILPPGKCGLRSCTASAQGFPNTSEYPQLGPAK